MEGLLRCGSAGSRAGAGFARTDTAPKPTSTVIGPAFLTPYRAGKSPERRCRLHQYLGSDSDGSSVSAGPGSSSEGKDAGVGLRSWSPHKVCRRASTSRAIS